MGYLTAKGCWLSATNRQNFYIQIYILLYFELVGHFWKPFILSYFVCAVSSWSLTLIQFYFATCLKTVVCLQFQVSLFTSLQTREPLALYSETMPYSYFINTATLLLQPLFSVPAKHPYCHTFFLWENPVNVATLLIRPTATFWNPNPYNPL